MGFEHSQIQQSEIDITEDNLAKDRTPFLVDREFIITKLKEFLTNSVSLSLYHEPVVSNDGFFHEKECYDSYYNKKSPYTREKLVTYNPAPIIDALVEELIKLDPRMAVHLYKNSTSYIDNREKIMNGLRNGNINIIEKYEDYQFGQELDNFFKLFFSLNPTKEQFLKIYNNSNLKNNETFPTTLLQYCKDDQIIKPYKEELKNQPEKMLTLLFSACQKNSINLMQILLDIDPDSVNRRDETGKTAIMMAINNLDLTKYLLEHGANPNDTDYDDVSVLEQAVKQHSKIETIIMIANQIKDVDIFSHDGKTILMTILEKGYDWPLIEYFIARGANLDSVDAEGKTLLHYALRRSRSEVCLQLIELTINLETEEQFGYRPIHLACLYQREDVIMALVFRGVLLDRPVSRVGDEAVQSLLPYNLIEYNQKMKSSQKEDLIDMITQIMFQSK